VDRSPGMLKVSQSLNPECEHLLGDMRSVRLNRQFDAVFVHDAIVYMTTSADLHRAIETAYTHCKAGGVVLLVPDFVRETFREHTKNGGHDGVERAMRYLQWTQDPDPSDSTYSVDFAYILRESDGNVHCEHDRHVCGLFSEQDWIKVMTDVGLEAHPETSPIEGEAETSLVFIGIKRP
jgi:trans-aconitate methyltransferase